MKDDFMNTLTLVVLGVVAWLFFLSGSSFLFLLSLAVLLLYSLVEVGGSNGHDHRHEQAGRSGEPGGNGAKMEEAAGMLGSVVNILGSFFGKLVKSAFFVEKKKEESKPAPQKIELTLRKR